MKGESGLKITPTAMNVGARAKCGHETTRFPNETQKVEVSLIAANTRLSDADSN